MTEKTVVCLKWGTWGGGYGHEYVNRLLRGVSRHLTDFKFICFTDDPHGIDPGIEVRDIQTLPLPPQQHYVHCKLALSHPDAGLTGNCLFLDLDVIVCGGLEDFFTYPGRYCIIRNWIERRKTILRARPLIGNSSVFRFKAGEWPNLVEKYLQDPICGLNVPGQKFMTQAVGVENITWWPEEWVRSFKYHCRPIFPMNYTTRPRIPQGTRILVFHGFPKMPEVIEGYDGNGKWHRKTLPMPEISEYWK